MISAEIPDVENIGFLWL